MRLIVCSSYWPRQDQTHKAMFEVEQVRALIARGAAIDVLVQTEPWRRGATFCTAAQLGLDPGQVTLHKIILPRLPERFAKTQLGARFNAWVTGLRMKAWLELFEQTAGPPDGIIIHGERNIGLSAGEWNLNGQRKAVMIVHGADPVLEALPSRALSTRFGGPASAALQQIILVGSRLRSYAHHLGYSEQKTRIVPNGFRAPPGIAPQSARDSGPLRLVSVARLVPVKGIDDTLNALSYVAARQPDLDWHFDILGDGPDRAALEQLCQRLGLAERVTFHGAVAHDVVLSSLAAGEIFVLPSWNEAFGLVYLEAMAMGTVVIGCLENGAGDILSDGEDGRLVPPRDVEALGQVLEELMVDRPQRVRLARAASVSMRRFTWEANADAILEALDLG